MVMFVRPTKNLQRGDITSFESFQPNLNNESISWHFMAFPPAPDQTVINKNARGAIEDCEVTLQPLVSVRADWGLVTSDTPHRYEHCSIELSVWAL